MAPMSNRKGRKAESNPARIKRRRAKGVARGSKAAADRRITDQRNAFLSLAGIGASGVVDISMNHDDHLSS